MKQFYTFGQAYGEGAYGAGTYSCTTQQQSQGLCDQSTGGGTGTTGGGANGGSSGANSGSLVDTGVAIAFAVTLACLLIFVAVVVRFIRRPRAVAQESVAETPHDGREQSGLGS